MGDHDTCAVTCIPCPVPNWEPPVWRPHGGSQTSFSLLNRYAHHRIRCPMTALEDDCEVGWSMPVPCSVPIHPTLDLVKA